MQKIITINPIFKENIFLARDLLAKKGFILDINLFNTLFKKKLELQKTTENIQSRINTISRQNKNSPDFLKNIENVKKLKLEINEIKEKLTLAENDFSNYYLTIPNIPYSETPDGKGEEDNVVIKVSGEIPTWNFQVKSHVELGRGGNIDSEAATEISGSRFVVLRNEIARLHRALISFMIDIHTNDGYEEHYVPYIVNEKALYGTGQLPKFKDDLYKLELDTNSYLIPTAEVPLTNLVADKILKESELPINMVAHTPCFRSEAGSTGRDLVGLIRQHQFEKVELVKVVRKEESYNELEKLLNQSEKVLIALGLPYQVVSLCGGDLGFSAAKTYDIEVWVPSQNKYREISSVSNCVDFQARRMHARYKTIHGNEYVHTLNGSGVAVGRCLIAILENYQQEDGSVIVPDSLVPYMGGTKKILTPK